MSVSIDIWQHLECPTPERCHCDCPPCRRAWYLAGRPARVVCLHLSSHIVLETAGRTHQPSAAKA